MHESSATSYVPLRPASGDAPQSSRSNTCHDTRLRMLRMPAFICANEMQRGSCARHRGDARRGHGVSGVGGPRTGADSRGGGGALCSTAPGGSGSRSAH